MIPRDFARDVQAERWLLRKSRYTCILASRERTRYAQPDLTRAWSRQAG